MAICAAAVMFISSSKGVFVKADQFPAVLLQVPAYFLNQISILHVLACKIVTRQIATEIRLNTLAITRLPSVGHLDA